MSRYVYVGERSAWAFYRARLHESGAEGHFLRPGDILADGREWSRNGAVLGVMIEDSDCAHIGGFDAEELRFGLTINPDLSDEHFGAGEVGEGNKVSPIEAQVAAMIDWSERFAPRSASPDKILRNVGLHWVLAEEGAYEILQELCLCPPEWR